MSQDNYPSDWNQRRKRVYRRDDFECSNCGRKGGPRGNTELHAHHIVPIKSGGSHNISNLATVCEGCHRAIHTGSKAPATSGNYSVASTNSARKAVVEMCSSAGNFFDDFVTLIRTIDDITVRPERETLEEISRCLDSLREQTPRMKKNLNQFEKHDHIQRRENELPELVGRYINTHRELVHLVAEYVDVVDETLEILEITRQAECPNCSVSKMRTDGTCGKCKATLQVSDNSVWGRYTENKRELNEVANKFTKCSDRSAPAADALAAYFE